MTVTLTLKHETEGLLMTYFARLFFLNHPVALIFQVDIYVLGHAR